MTETARIITDRPREVRPRMPVWLKRGAGQGGERVRQCLRRETLVTVCEEARCPNRSECFGRGTATFLVMGDVCTRACRFCAIRKGTPAALQGDEPRRLVRAVGEMKLTYVVITSVSRDDLPDGGAGHFAAAVTALKTAFEHLFVEVLIPDFGGNFRSLETVLASGPHVLNHNVETVARLYPAVRPQADYLRSLGVLRAAAGFGRALKVKSGLMLGLGERHDEIVRTMEDIRSSGCTILTIGQYLQPSAGQAPVVEFVAPQRFEQYERLGREMGYEQVVAGPFVRSSYRAEGIFKRNMNLAAA